MSHSRISDSAKKVKWVVLAAKKGFRRYCTLTVAGTSGARHPNNFSISFSAETRNDADDKFAKLSQGGQVTMPMQNMFWGSYFGSLTDQFGINWMVSYSPTEGG